VPWGLPQMGNFGQKRRGFGALPHHPSARQPRGAWAVAVFQRQGQGSAAAAPGIPGHGNLCPGQPKEPKTLPTPAVFSLPDKTPSFLPILAHRSGSPGAACSPSLLDHPPWEAGPGAGAVPEGCPRLSPSAAGDAGTRQRAGRRLRSLPATNTHPDSAALVCVVYPIPLGTGIGDRLRRKTHL